MSKTYIYGVGVDGHCLAKAQLTEDAVFEMLGNAKKHAKNRREMLATGTSRAQGGFELLMQLDDEGPLRAMMPKIIDAWNAYFTYTDNFTHIKPALVNEGLHLILVGWFTPQKRFRMRPVICVLPGDLSDEQIVVMSRMAFEAEARELPENQPCSEVED